ncbi:MAG: magnesium/cobalt transporter CorA [Gammaproteobacteria bacterium]|nr:magnesium/cobalt transporter CorA [Gammaproteobacteria bacterium]MBU3989518.1 magnesium/cobalt transporter CorA [Gammaproteobacteria bacterium]MBU4005552.1 magnesium/cobalt transporter CorA [Gammaproteobacteria bacterium]MBU4020895.1 magnesium/cobalt transporter CorA [Gammaproteobacteria bacterium]MBU4096714.1 magnesium/cobalt transporter CorA [Gammaproteobacteria bacterium]
MVEPLDVRPRPEDPLEQHLSKVQLLLSRHRRIEDLVHRQDMPRHELVEDLVHKQHLTELQQLLEGLETSYIARILEALPEEDCIMAWQQVSEERCERVLEILPDDLREELVGARSYASVRSMLNAFELKKGRLSQVQVDSRADLANIKPIWVDLVAPSAFVRVWVGKYFGLELPDPDDLTDLEASARFYIDDNGEVHLHSDFLLETETESRNVAVAFVLHRDILFSVRKEELPVFRLQRLRARSQPGYVSDGKDVLLDLYAADAEYSADALEDVYAGLEKVGKRVLGQSLTDAEAAQFLAAIASEEDLNGRIRRNVLDDRRALSFLLRSKFLLPNQQDDARQILRDIESLDGHTTFLFGKINFLMDATVGFININQNKIIKIFSVVSVGLLPPTLIASIYGMNFRFMPELEWQYGYPFSLALMAAAVAVPFWIFRKKGWLR